MDTYGLGLVHIFAFALGLALLIAWIILPFAVIGTKPLLEQLIYEVRRTNELLQQGRSSAVEPRTDSKTGLLGQLGQNAAAEWRELRGK